jgi:hypothetical protein
MLTHWGRMHAFGFDCRELEVSWERRLSDRPFASPEQERAIRTQLEETLVIDREIYQYFFPTSRMS